MTETNTTTPPAVADPLERMAALLERAEQRSADEEARIQQRIDDAVSTAVSRLSGAPSTPSREEHRANPTDYVHDRFDELGYTRSDFEVAGLVFEGSGRMRSRPTPVAMPDDFLRAWRHHVLEAREHPIFVGDGSGRAVRRLGRERDGSLMRAMDAQETGYGLELIGAQYVRDMWAAARNLDSLAGDIRVLPMAAPTVYVPIDGNIPEMLFVGESTSSSATAYTTSKTASNRVSMTAKKFTIQQIWSGELDEDSIIAFTPFLRQMLNMSAALHLGSAYLNGDETNAGTGNINLDDANPADTKHYLAWDGIRHYWLVDATGQGKDMGNLAIDPREINVARGKLNGGDDDVDNLIKNINWGLNPRDLRLVCDWDTYMALLDTDKVTTVDKYGAGATILTGELGSLYGIPIISPSYATKTEADGKCSDTEASNTRGQITIFNPNGFLGGVRREVQLFFDRIQRTDQFLFELYTRRAFTRFGGNVAAGIYNIAL